MMKSSKFWACNSSSSEGEERDSDISQSWSSSNYTSQVEAKCFVTGDNLPLFLDCSLDVADSDGAEERYSLHHPRNQNEESFLAKSSLEYAVDPNDPNKVWDFIKSALVFSQVPKQASYSGSTLQCTRIVCMSDTHGKHRDIPFLSNGDILIHAGDFTKAAESGSVKALNEYFKEQESKYDHILCIAGNHDVMFQPEFYLTSKRFKRDNPFATKAALVHCKYLEDSSMTFLKGSVELSIYGTPWAPAYYDWAFNLPRGSELNKIYSAIPTATDVLISHGPPLGRDDFTNHSGRAGCHDLLLHVQNRIRPRVHVFGHIHQGYGYSFDGQTLYVNASNLVEKGGTTNKCVVVDLPHDKSQPAMVVQPHCGIDTVSKLLDWLKIRK